MSRPEDPPRPADPLPEPATGQPQARASEAPAPPRRGCAGTLWALAATLLGGIYILNPGWGVFELLPDNLPGLGNLDEAGAAALLIFGLRYLVGRRGRS